MDARRGGGGGQEGGARIAPPPKKKEKFFGYIGGLFATFSSYGGVLLPFSHFWGPFCYFLLHGGDRFLGLPPPPRTFLRAPLIARRVREHAPRKFFYVTAI